MISAALLLALSAHAAAADPAKDINHLFTHIEKIEVQQENQDARTIKDLDHRIEALGPQAMRYGAQAVPPLAAILGDSKRSLKTRLWALSFLALIHDPSALDPLKNTLYDPAASMLLRADAASAIPNVEISASAQSLALCQALSLDLPQEALRQTLFGLSRLGCDDAAALETRAKQFGARPKSEDADTAGLAIDALGRSHPVEAARALWRVFAFFPPGSYGRLKSLEALLLQRDSLLVFEPEAFHSASDALYSESNTPPNAVQAAKLLASLDDPKAVPVLLRFLKNKDAEVATTAAEGLAHLKAAAAQKPVEKLLAGVLDDPRFAPIPGRTDPGELMERLQRAAAALK
jgi:HEAT repeat protein